MGTSSRFEPPIGRGQALSEIELLLRESAARQQTAIVRVSGPPGIGKSNILAAAFTRYAQDRAIAAAASPADIAEPGACARRLGLSLYDEPPHLNVLCLDDLQWVDELSVRVIGNAIRNRGIRLALFGDRRDAAPELPLHATIFLEPLNDDDAAQLVCTLSPNASAVHVASIVRAAAGLPFNLTVLAHDADRTSSDLRPQSVYVTIARRLERAAPRSRNFVRTCALVEGAADIRVIARACDMTVDQAGADAAEFSDLLVVSGVTVMFRHELFRSAVAGFVDEPLAAYRRLLAVYLDEEQATNRAAVVLHCAMMCGDDAVAAAFAFTIGREAAARGASATAARYLEICLRHAPALAPVEYVVEYATVLQHLGREANAASYLRRELRQAIAVEDAVRAAELAMSFSSVAVTLERGVEFRSVCERIETMPGGTEAVRRRVRSARLSYLAFSGSFDEYHALRANDDPGHENYRMCAFVNAIEGDPAAARTSFARYQAGVRNRDSRQDPADRVFEAVIGLHAIGNAALLDLERDLQPEHIETAYQAVAQFKILARICDGRWAEAAAIIALLPLWEKNYEEPLATIDARLSFAALARQAPAEQRRAQRIVKALIARGQVTQAVSPARWLLITSARGLEDANIASFVEETLAQAPPAHLVTGSPIALALLADRFGKDRCLAALERWPQYGSRWLTAHRQLAYALLRSDHAVLREVRDEFERLGAPAFAMIGGLALPAPRSRDIELARVLGYAATSHHGDERLTARENDVAELVAQGSTNREIAERLAIRERTVEVHLSNAFRKLGLRTRTDLARYVLSRDQRES